MKKLIISAETLKPALSKLSHVVQQKSFIPAAGSLYCKVKPNQLELTGTNTEITIIIKLDCECSETFDFLLPFDFINKIVAINRHMPIEIQVDKKVKIITQSDAYDIKVSDKLEDFPKTPAVPQKNSISIPAETMDCLQIALATVAPGYLNRPMLMNVLLELKAGKMIVASTDGAYQVYTKHFESENLETEQFLLNKKFLSVIDTGKPSKLFYHSKHVAFEIENTVIISTRINGQYVNYMDIFPSDWPPNLILQKDVLEQAMQKCSLASDEYKKTTLNLKKKGELKFTSDDHAIKVNVVVEGDYTGDVEVTALNSEAVLNVLGQVETDEIELAIHDARKSIVLTSKNHPGYKGLLMPLAT